MIRFKQIENNGKVKGMKDVFYQKKGREKMNTINENVPNNYPKNIMYELRQREGLDKNDTNKDDQLNSLSKNEVFREVLYWNGLLGGYDHTIKAWVKDIYGIDLNEIEQIK